MGHLLHWFVAFCPVDVGLDANLPRLALFHYWPSHSGSFTSFPTCCCQWSHWKMGHWNLVLKCFFWSFVFGLPHIETTQE